ERGGCYPLLSTPPTTGLQAPVPFRGNSLRPAKRAARLLSNAHRSGRIRDRIGSLLTLWRTRGRRIRFAGCQHPSRKVTKESALMISRKFERFVSSIGVACPVVIVLILNVAVVNTTPAAAQGPPQGTVS